MTVIRDGGRAIGLLMIGLLSLGPSFALLLQHPYDSGEFLLGIAFGVIALACLTAARQGVIADERGVLLRYPLRSRFLPWEDIVCFKVTDVRNALGERSAKPAAILGTGQAVALPGANRFSLLPRGDAHRFPVVDQLEKHRHGAKGLS